MKRSSKPGDPDWPIILGNLSSLLEGKSEHEGFPVCRSVDEQMRVVHKPHLIVYPNGNVMFFYRSGCGVQWNPDVPLKEHFSP